MCCGARTHNWSAEVIEYLAVHAIAPRFQPASSRPLAGTSFCRTHVRTHRVCSAAFLKAPRHRSCVQPLILRPCGLMDKALVFGTKDCRFESCQGHASKWAHARTGVHGAQLCAERSVHHLQLPNTYGTDGPAHSRPAVQSARGCMCSGIQSVPLPACRS